MNVTVDNLDEVMEFDHVILVHEHGSVTHPENVYAPDLSDGELTGDGWSLLMGYTGQFGYRGPIMHPSEYIGGRMAEHILSHPGYYVTLVSYSYSEDEDSANDGDGWAVAYRESL